MTLVKTGLLVLAAVVLTACAQQEEPMAEDTMMVAPEPEMSKM